MDSTIERNIEIGGWKGELHLDTRIRVTIPSENRQNINVGAVKRMNETNKREAVQPHFKQKSQFTRPPFEKIWKL